MSIMNKMDTSGVRDVEENQDDDGFVRIPATALRERGSEIINRVAYGNEEFVLTRRGKPVAALVSLEALEALRRLEDAADLAAVAAAHEEIKQYGTIPWEDVKAELHA